MWTGARGLADDVRYYGQWMRDRAFERIGHLYPKVSSRGARRRRRYVIAWLWARTVLCPNPACGARMPLVRSFALSTKPGKTAWAEPVIDHAAKRYGSKYGGSGKPQEGTKQRGRQSVPILWEVIPTRLRSRAGEANGYEAMPSLLSSRKGSRRSGISPLRGFDRPTVPDVDAPWLDQPLPTNPRWFSTPGYGLPTFPRPIHCQAVGGVDNV